MEKKKYSDKMKDPRWQKKRLEIFERDGWSCCRCGDTESTLNVHHLRYVPGHDPWDYPNYLESINKLYVAIIFFLFAGLHYLLLYNKKRWAGYIEEFKNESSQQRKKGTVLVLLYLVGSILLFFALMPILFS